MEDTQLSTGDILKQFASKVTTSSVGDRVQIWSSLGSCISKSDFPEPAVKGILRLSLLTLSRYRDKKSRQLTKDLIVKLVRTRPEVANQQLILVVSDYIDSQKQRPSTCSSNSFESFVLLSWLCAVQQILSPTAIDFSKLIDVESTLVHSALSAPNKRLIQSVHRVLQRNWKMVPTLIDSYIQVLTSVELTIDKLMLIGCLVKFLMTKKDVERINKLKLPFIDAYMKLVIGGKVKLESHVVDAYRFVLRHVSHDEFKSLFLPAIERSLLRNPETAIVCVRDLLSSVNIDLSSYCVDIGRHLATQCRSNEESYHQFATDACLNLAKQCSDTSALESLVKNFFAVINGSEGKLAGLPQKFSLITAIGNLCQNSVSGTGSIQALATSVVELFMVLLQSEGHEATIVHEIGAMSVWCAKFTTAVPAKLIKFFATALTLKTSTSAVRTAYVNCMNSAFEGDTLQQGAELFPALLQLFEKAAGQPTQAQLVTEAATMACFISKLLTVESIPDAKLGTFWNVLLDTDKQLHR